MLDTDAATIIADLTQTVTIGETSYACAAADAVQGMAPDLQGIFADADLMIVVRTALFTTRPVANDTLTYEGDTYRIERVSTSPDDVTMTLHCVAKTRRG
ncbi:MAG: hypothetical protein ABIH03_17140 [Pseudomonadota bacterium]